MSFKHLPDLGKIGKRIGKRLRDILNPPVDHGPSKEERLAQRLSDSLKGLVYFDNFDEIEEWVVKDVDPVQQSNTPLLERAATQVYSQKGPTSRVLLCHDYSGGYHEWEGVRPVAVSKQPYSCKYFQYVETFVYFSHKIVCVPPASWINACHRNGVKILGTFMMEGDGHAKSIERMFEEVNGEYVVARRLASMAHAYGFDGWLLNIEADFPYTVQHPISNLTSFVRSLKRFLGPNGIVIWYDAITKDNDVEYQNALTWKNVEFALAADALFTNYKWTKQELHKSQAVAEQHGLRPGEVYFGIDVWAQNNNMPGPPRVTYPPKGGGGTLTGLATHVVAQEGFSTAIFGPAWPYEHFENPVKQVLSGGPELDASGCEKPFEPRRPSTAESVEPAANELEAVAVERAMWDGTQLPDELSCSCKNGCPHHRPGYRDMPIKRAAREYPAGSCSFFQTNFQQAFYKVVLDDGISSRDKCSWIPDPGSHATLPDLWQEKDVSDLTFDAELRYDGSSFLHLGFDPPAASKLTYLAADDHQAARIARRRLFKTNFTADTTMEVAANFKLINIPSTMTEATIGFYTKSILQDSGQLKIVDYKIPYRKKHTRQNTIFTLDKPKSNARIVEVGIFGDMGCYAVGPVEVLDLYDLIIRPKTEAEFPCSLAGPEIYRRMSGELSEQRLRWAWNGSKELWPAGIPWSDSTGPFSVFSIMVEDKVLGKAHCMEFPLRPDDCPKHAKNTVTFTIQGHLFGGGAVFSSQVAEYSEARGFWTK